MGLGLDWTGLDGTGVDWSGLESRCGWCGGEDVEDTFLRGTEGNGVKLPSIPVMLNFGATAP